jgi:ABC-2 type transport system ATP-binding protein
MSLLHVNQLTKKFSDSIAVNQISFTIQEGHCVSLLGPNGAGKTTTLKMLSGLLAPSEGVITFKGMDKAADIRQFIGFLPQHPSFYPWMSGLEFLVYAARLTHLSKVEANRRALELIELVGIGEAKHRRIAGYSGGMKQRLGLAQAMIHKPRLLILDEPVSALDPVGRRDVLNLMNQIKKETTILFSTHVLHDAEGISDDVLIIRKGEIVISGSLNAVRTEHQQPIIIIEFEQDQVLEEWISVWKENKIIKEIHREHHTLKVVVNHLDSAKLILLKDIVDKQLDIRKFEVAQTTLEDLFMKAVNL